MACVVSYADFGVEDRGLYRDYLSTICSVVRVVGGGGDVGWCSRLVEASGGIEGVGAAGDRVVSHGECVVDVDEVDCGLAQCRVGGGDDNVRDEGVARARLEEVEACRVGGIRAGGNSGGRTVVASRGGSVCGERVAHVGTGGRVGPRGGASVGRGANYERNQAARDRKRGKKKGSSSFGERPDVAGGLPAVGVAASGGDEVPEWRRGSGPVSALDVMSTEARVGLAGQRARLFALRNEREEWRLKREIAMERTTAAVGANAARVAKWCSKQAPVKNKSVGSSSDGLSSRCKTVFSGLGGDESDTSIMSAGELILKKELDQARVEAREAKEQAMAMYGDEKKRMVDDMVKLKVEIEELRAEIKARDRLEGVQDLAAEFYGIDDYSRF